MTFTPLPDLKAQFVTDFYEPVSREMAPFKLNMQERYEQAVARYEQAHGHKCPVSFSTFKREYYERGRG